MFFRRWLAGAIAWSKKTVEFYQATAFVCVWCGLGYQFEDVLPPFCDELSNFFLMDQFEHYWFYCWIHRSEHAITLFVANIF